MVIGEKVNFESHCQTAKEISRQEKCLQSEWIVQLPIVQIEKANKSQVLTNW